MKFNVGDSINDIRFSESHPEKYGVIVKVVPPSALNVWLGTYTVRWGGTEDLDYDHFYIEQHCENHKRADLQVPAEG